MNVRTHLIIIKGKDQTDMVASFRFHDRICEVIYSSAPNKAYEFKSSNVEILPLQKKINPSEVIVTANGQNISGIDELLDFGAYYRIVRNGKKVRCNSRKIACQIEKIRKDFNTSKILPQQSASWQKMASIF